MHDVAGIMGNGGSHKGQKLLSTKACHFLNTPLTSGLDRVVLRPITYGPGTILFPVEQKQVNTKYRQWGIPIPHIQTQHTSTARGVETGKYRQGGTQFSNT